MVWKVLLVIAVILVIVLVALYYFGRKLEKRQAEGQAQLDAAAQTVSMLIIDKKKLRMKESGLPQMVIDQIQDADRKGQDWSEDYDPCS